ncbi:hypothetical protein ASG90_15580 [Nocardioides sp. Soil797]|nr:hypothetical protein ASG90_15580 [Nocardioides sp. Soil797]
MRRGACVKCLGTTIYQVASKGGRFGGYQDLWLGKGHTNYFLVCGQCGYTERYVNPEALARLDEHGTRLPPRA